HSNCQAYFFTVTKKRHPLPLILRDHAIGEEILELFRAAHAQRPEPVSRLPEPQFQRPFQLVCVHVGALCRKTRFTKGFSFITQANLEVEFTEMVTPRSG